MNIERCQHAFCSLDLLLTKNCTFINSNIHTGSASRDKVQAQEDEGSVYYKRKTLINAQHLPRHHQRSGEPLVVLYVT
jgi:hypothetical protein